MCNLQPPSPIPKFHGIELKCHSGKNTICKRETWALRAVVHSPWAFLSSPHNGLLHLPVGWFKCWRSTHAKWGARCLCLFTLLTIGGEKESLCCVKQHERSLCAVFVQLWPGSAISYCSEGPVNRLGKDFHRLEEVRMCLIVLQVPVAKTVELLKENAHLFCNCESMLGFCGSE